MRVLRWIIPIILLTVVLSGCDKKEWHPLTKVDTQMIPYKMGDTIHFIDEKGEQALCWVDKDIVYRERFTDGYFISISEIREVRLVSEHNDLEFILDVAAWRWWKDNSLFISMGKDKAEFETHYDSKGNLENRNNLEINKHTYYDVVVLDSWRGVQLYYNKTYGILQVTQNGKNIFTLIP